MAIIKSPLVKEYLETHDDGVVFFLVHSPNVGKAVLQEETGDVYGDVAITDSDPYTYSEFGDYPHQEEEATEEDYKSALNALGVSTDEEV